LAKAAREVCFDFLHINLTCRQAEIVNLGHCSVWVFANADDQAEPQRLLAFVAGYRWSNLCGAELRGCIVRSNTVPVVASIEISPAARTPVEV